MNSRYSLLKQVCKEKGTNISKVASAIGRGEDLKNWAKKDRDIPQDFGLYVELCKELDCRFADLVPELKEMKNEEGEKMYKNLITQVNKDVRKTSFFEGIDAVIAGKEMYWQLEEDAEDEDRARCYLTLYNPKTDEWVGMLDFGEYLPSSIDYIIKSDYITVPSTYADEYDLREQTKRAKAALDNWLADGIKKAKQSQKKPVFIVESLFGAIFLGYSLEEEKVVTVIGYKTYNNNYIVADTDEPNCSVLGGFDEYEIITPSKADIRDLDLELNDSLWTKKNIFDAVKSIAPEIKPRDLTNVIAELLDEAADVTLDEKTKVFFEDGLKRGADVFAEELLHCYDKACKYRNLLNTTNNYNCEVFQILKNRVDRLEEFLDIGPVCLLLASEFRLVYEAVAECDEIIFINKVLDIASNKLVKNERG